MFLLEKPEKILILIFLITSMMSIGMQTRISEIKSVIASKDFLIRTFLTNFVIVPIVGTIIVRIFPLSPPVESAILLLAFTPGGLSAIQFTSHVKGSAALSGAMVFFLSLLAIFVSPLMLYLVLPKDLTSTIPYGQALIFLLVYLLLPILIGMYILNKVPHIATKFSKLVGLVGVATFLAFMIITSSDRKEALGQIGITGVIAMLLFILVSMVIGWFMGGSSRDARQILATATSMRNAVLCVGIVQSSSPDNTVLVPLIAFSLLMVPPNMLFAIYSIVQSKRKTRQ
jgi:predicted Na+-dependent transporter